MGRRSPPQHDDGRKPQGEASPTVWEWMVAGLGAVLVSGTLAFLLVQAVRGGGGPPDPVAEIVAIDAQQGRFLVRVRVRNRGASPAENLRLSGRLSDGGRTIEEAETEFRYLPSDSSREAGLFFATDPAQAQLELRVHSYQAP